MSLRLSVVVVLGVGVMVPPVRAVSAGGFDGSPVLEYFEALDRRDFDAAMDARCQATRLDSANRDDFLAAVDRVAQAYASLRPAAVERVKSTWDMSSVERVHAVYQYSFQLTDGHVVVAGEVFSVIEGGRERLCGWREWDNPGTFQLIGLMIRPSPGRLGDFAALPALTHPAYAWLDHSTETPDFGELADAIEVSSVAWQRKGYGGARMSAFRFRTTVDVLEAAAEALEGLLPVSFGQVFAPAEWPGSVGVRWFADSWTWAQSVYSGAMCDRVVAPTRSELVQLEVCGSDPQEIRDVVLELTRGAIETLS